MTDESLMIYLYFLDHISTNWYYQLDDIDRAD